MITRRTLLKGVAASVAAATLIRVETRKQWYPTAYHNVVVSDPDSSWRVTKYPGNYDESTMSADKEWYGRQRGWAKTRAFVRGEITYEEYAG